MASVSEHYSTHLAPVYVWMAGGIDSALARGDAEIAAVLPAPCDGGTAVDLGAGFGMHAVPLARRGWSVTAIDSSALLLEALRAAAQDLPVETAEVDLLDFGRHVLSPVNAILIMGDTLTHLPDFASVSTLCRLAAEALHPGGHFIATFRDYTLELDGAQRFHPVKSDDMRILTCLLEYGAEHVDVSDRLHERRGTDWELKVSTYRKLRLSPASVAAALEENGFTVRLEPGLSGMVRLVAIRNSPVP
jgi:SAM-dependent methyltransferase